MPSYSLSVKHLESITNRKAERRVARNLQEDKFFKGNTKGMKIAIRKRVDK